MNYTRRKFLSDTTLLSGGLALFGSHLLSMDELFVGKARSYGIQLYSLRDILPADPFGIIKKLSEAGYTSIESYEGEQGVYWGKSPKEFASFLKSSGLTMPSFHCNVFENFEKKVADAASIGVQYVICPWIGPQKSLDDYKKMAARFNEMGAICKKNGIRFAYHNHDYSFKPMNGVTPQTLLMEETDPKLVFFEMDIYWVVAAGGDPIEWFERYPNRFRLAHIKDRSKKPVADEGKNSVVIGTGTIDFASILQTGRAKGLKEFIFEQEANYGKGPLESAIASLKYLQEKKF
ncbi:MAG: sugar phosphate isomerase/epimerase family protein [Bacteroidota bacterium]|jgi:sugar phosphate isomerase/epimerase